MDIRQIRDKASADVLAHLGETVETGDGPVQALVQRHDDPDIRFKGRRQAQTASSRWQYLIIHVREQDADRITGTVRIDGRDWAPVERSRHVVQPGLVQIELAPVADRKNDDGGQWQ